jgi:hypothetical protein
MGVTQGLKSKILALKAENAVPSVISGQSLTLILFQVSNVIAQVSIIVVMRPMDTTPAIGVATGPSSALKKLCVLRPRSQIPFAVVVPVGQAGRLPSAFSGCRRLLETARPR